jgi:hypothetical protein
LHNDELHSLYSSPNIVRVIKSRRMRWAGHVARMEEGRSVYRVLVGRPEGKRPLGRPRRRWEDNIKMDLKEIGIDGANRIQLAQDRFHWRACINTAMNLRVHTTLTSWTYNLKYINIIWCCRVRFPVGAGNFSLHHCVQNGSEAHPVSYPMGTRGSLFPWF